jgi:hypothetical protein
MFVVAAVVLVCAVPVSTAAGAPRKWVVVASPNRSGQSSYLSGIACASVVSCVAVGYSASPSVAQTLIEMWDGSAWSLADSPNAGASSELTSVACAATDDCVAVGWDQTAAGNYETLIERWDGTTWSIEPSPNVTGVLNMLRAVSCPTTTTCVAVGTSAVSGGSDRQGLIEIWDGTHWSVTPSPTPSSNDDLFGISCVDATSCAAVGLYWVTPKRALTLVEHWDGTSWVVVPSPNERDAHGYRVNALKSVSCPTSAFCIAAGVFNGGAGRHTARRGVERKQLVDQEESGAPRHDGERP